MEDNEITELLLSRSQEGITALSEKYGKTCMNIAMNLLRNRQDAEECVNDALFAIWNAIPPQRPESLKLYMFRTVRNTSLDRIRKREAEKEKVDRNLEEGLMETLTSNDPLPDEQIEYLEFEKTINDFLKTRNKLDRMIFVRRTWFFEDYETIAKRTGLRPGTIITRMHRIRKKLKEYLDRIERSR